MKIKYWFLYILQHSEKCLVELDLYGASPRATHHFSEPYNLTWELIFHQRPQYLWPPMSDLFQHWQSVFQTTYRQQSSDSDSRPFRGSRVKGKPDIWNVWLLRVFVSVWILATLALSVWMDMTINKSDVLLDFSSFFSFFHSLSSVKGGGQLKPILADFRWTVTRPSQGQTSTTSNSHFHLQPIWPLQTILHLLLAYWRK